MDLRSRLLLIADAYAEARGLSAARVATLVFNDGQALARIRAGGDVQTATWERAMRWFSANWPEAAAWPAGIERPPALEASVPEPLGPENCAPVLAPEAVAQ